MPAIMKMKFSNRLFGIAALCLTASFLSAPHLSAQSSKDAVTMLSGDIIATGDKSITLHLGLDTTTQYTISPTATVLIDGKSAKISDLKAGYPANIAVSDGIINAIYARTPNNDSWGLIAAIDPASITITAKSGDRNSFGVAAATKTIVLGKSATIGDLQVGMLVHVTYADGNIATAIEAVRRDFLRYPGKITKVSSTSITLESTIADPQTLGINASTTVTIDGKPKATSDIHTGWFAEATSADGSNAVTITVTTKKPTKGKEPNPDGGGTPQGGVSL